MNKIYISGRITGNPEYREQFEKAELSLQNEYYIVNPIKLADFFLPDCTDWVKFMKLDIKYLLNCTHVYMLKGWEHSRGAKIEHQLAKDLNMTIIYE